ncbi:MAG TPA: DUF4389 domain-containing protein [Spirochaetota bacterium]|nr:DUF4389 domain-containing protein [Spirochaetota bacterium]HPL17554.1 DUF4389 domain-containing protein [Spirochaetota bacterium]HQJ69113.1 DUF4389 domain-containing protein [Spirochaetota bacterium]HRS75923.1 DUF4389 domain-containing protein [Spirochaetota bacterium]HRT75052.1 DUF4389 domain-containing protein [Spirochaetota bacterium]
MIVRCKNCNSAFAVDDGKVKDKKFAFTCPKCDSENVIDNRKELKAAVAGPTVIDEEYNEMSERSARDEAVASTGRDNLFEESMAAQAPERASKSDVLSDDGLMLDESAMVDTDDLSGLAEPEKMEEIDTSLEHADLPPADDMRSDVPLDDINIDDDLKNLGLTDIDLDLEEKRPAKEEKPPRKAAGDTIFEDLDLETGEGKLESDVILDEMDLKEDTNAPVHLDEIDDIDKLLAEDDRKKEIVDDFEPLEVETEHIESKPLAPDMVLDEEIKTEEVYRAKEPAEDESITIDLDTLDIDLEDADKKAPAKVEAPLDFDLSDKEETPRHEPAEDESITIDLDTLDIDLQEDKEPMKGESHEDLDLDLSDFSDETIQELEEVTQKPQEKDDESITLDLNSLDISLEESDEIKKGEDLGEDEKLTLEDAGLTLEELTTDELVSVSSESDLKHAEEEDIKLSISEIAPDIDMNEIEKELKEAESILVEPPRRKEDLLVVDELSDLPEIDFDKDLELVGIDEEADTAAVSKFEDELFSLDEGEKGAKARGGLRKELPDMVPKGAVNFSIDYSLKYSRIGALLRLFGIFFIGLIPHFVVFFVYNVLSIILSFINHILVIFTEKNMEDFSEIHENTLRYLLSICASSLGIVEELPIFAGRDNIDYPLQMRIIYPIRSSRFLAFLRLSVLGIIVLTLPHLIILSVISLVIPLVFIAGILSVLATGGWPHLLFDFMNRFYRYTARVLAFSIGIVDVYPRFKFD